MLTQKQLVQILGNPESYNIEITTSTTNMDKFCQAICAFSNDLPGDDKSGYLIIGAEDNGKLSGLRVDDGLLLKMTNIRTDGNILPQPVMTVERFVLEGGDLLVVEVKPSEFPPVRYRGRIWVRIGPRKSIASEAEEKILMERRISNILQTISALLKNSWHHSDFSTCDITVRRTDALFCSGEIRGAIFRELMSNMSVSKVWIVQGKSSMNTSSGITFAMTSLK